MLSSGSNQFMKLPSLEYKNTYTFTYAFTCTYMYVRTYIHIRTLASQRV